MPFYPAHGTCDYCGCDIQDTDYINIVVHAPMSWQDNEHGVVFEYWNKGAYCYDCLEKLSDAIMNAIPVPERYDNAFSNENKCIEIEKNLIASIDM